MWEPKIIYSFVGILLTLLFGGWLNAVKGALGNLSPGMIRKLDSQGKNQLIGRAERWLEERETYRIAIRLILMMCLGMVAMLLHFIGDAWLTLKNPTATNLYRDDVLIMVVICAAATLIFVVATELLAGLFIGVTGWPLLSASMPLVRLMNMLFFPFVRATVFLQERAESWHGKDDEADKPTMEDEILSLVEQDASEEDEDATLEDSERRMIRGIFDLDETVVREIMTPRVDIKAISADAPLEDALRRFVETGHSRIPVYRESVDHIIGVLYAKDLLDQERLRKSSNIADIMHESTFVPETKDVKTLLEEFKQTRIQMAVVIDEYGGTAGLVTIEDILEEIVGEIQDEYDKHDESATIALAEDGSVDVDARTPIGEINELLDVRISDEEDYDTIGGCVNSELGRIPKTNEVFQLDDLEVLVLEADERKITRLRLRKITAALTGDSD